jgi:CysZ protein
MKNTVKSIAGLPTGFFTVFEGLKMIFTTKGLRRFVFIPFLLNATLLVLIIYAAITRLYPFLSSHIPQSGEWYFTVIRVIAVPLFILITLMVSLITYSIAGTAFCAPFADPLSERIEKIVTGVPVDIRFSMKKLIISVWRSVVGTLVLIAFLIIFNLMLLFLNLIPVVGNIAYTVLQLMLFFLFLGSQLMDIVLVRKELSMGERLSFLWRYKSGLIGVGAGFALLSYIPVVGFLSPIVGVAATTLIYCRGEKIG